ncbi:hypothetical protein ACFL02_07835 [Planctomycetota bacterium]
MKIITRKQEREIIELIDGLAAQIKHARSQVDEFNQQMKSVIEENENLKTKCNHYKERCKLLAQTYGLLNHIG